MVQAESDPTCSRISICFQWKFEDPVAKAPLETNGAEDPIVSIAPKKPNSDLQLLLDFCLFFKRERFNSKVLSLHGCSEA
ncbi:unnamed protein product [Sphagnum troendelagicum]